MKTLEGCYYTDPGIWRAEIESFYFDMWVCAGRTESIPQPGDYFLVDLCGESVIVTRGPEGSIHAFYNVCRHRGTRMCTEQVGTFSGRIQCPYHGWTYSLTGDLTGAPHMQDPEFRHQDFGLHRLHTAAWDGHIFLHAGSDPPSLASQLGTLAAKFARWRMQDLRIHRRIVYEVEANWKLVVLNYNECLHCPLVHPALNRLTDYLGADNEAPSDSWIGGSMGFRDGAETMSTDGRRRRAFLPDLSEEERHQVCYYAIYPNLLLSLHPDYMMVHRLWPKSPSHTQIVCEFFFHPDEMAKSGFEAEDAIAFWDQTNREDWEMVERSQAGIRSRAYTPSPYTAREELLHAFDQTVLRKLAGRKTC